MMTKRRHGSWCSSWARAAVALAAIYLLAIQSVLPRAADATGLSSVAVDIICVSGQSADGPDSGGDRHPSPHLTDCCVLSARFQLDGPLAIASVAPRVVTPDAVRGQAWPAIPEGRAPPSRRIDPNRLRGPPADLV